MIPYCSKLSIITENAKRRIHARYHQTLFHINRHLNSSGTREVFWEKALDKGEITDKANVVVSNGAMKTAVANDPYGIGYVSVGHMDDSTAPVILDGAAPTIDNVKNGSYKIARGLFSNTKGEPKGLVKKFIDFLFSPEGQELASKNGFIPVK